MSICDCELLDDEGIAKKLKHSKRHVRTLRDPKLTDDPLPSIRLGKAYRYIWGSPEMETWLKRRATSRRVR